MLAFPFVTAANQQSLTVERGRTMKAHDTTLEKDNRVSFGFFEQHQVIFVIRKYPWKYSLLLSSFTWQSTSFCPGQFVSNPSSDVLGTERGLTGVTKLGPCGEHLISMPSDKWSLTCHFTSWRRVYEENHCWCPFTLTAPIRLNILILRMEYIQSRFYSVETLTYS